MSPSPAPRPADLPAQATSRALHRQRYITQVALGYAVLALAWIFLSDQLLSAAVGVEAMVRLSTAKGVFFVFVSALAFYMALRGVPERAPASSGVVHDPIARGLPQDWPTWLPYLLGSALVLGMLLIRWLIDDGAQGRAMLVLYTLPISLAALLGGMGPGLLATALAAVLSGVFVLEPVGMLAIDHPHDRFQWAMLLASGVIISWVSDALLRSRERSRLRLQALDASHAALLASEARAQQLFDDAPVAMGLVAWDGRILSLNHQFTALFGYGSNDLRHIDDWWRLPHPDEAYRNELRRLWEMQQQGRPPPFIAEAAAEHRVLAANGRELTVQISRHPMDQGLLTTFVDITAAREAEKQLRLSTAALAQAQAQALEQMQALNATLETRVTERTRELAALNQSLESFVYSVSHDLKAPLRGVEGYSRFLLEDYGSQLGDEGRLFIGNIRAGVARMGELIDDLLAYSRMERRQLAREPVDLADLVAQVVAERAKEMAAGPVELQLDIAPLKVQADRDGLEMVLRNLLENAIKFTAHAPAPRITLTARRSDTGVELSVTDNGIGFDMKYHDRIFEIFQRLQRVEDYPGTGVGLALVKKAMDRMGGRVWAQSAPGQGASFHLELPLARSPS